ncbi:MAG TPA: carboxypeptidase regulatory-like domain-containing protein [Rhodanobacteraceae bacterium]|nr:carboxypeptidase regulatory-like domain-containing protein [Rhodanobacteraceae bacterium]
MLLAAGDVEAASIDGAIDALRDIALRTETATRETLQAHAALRDADTATIRTVKSLRSRFDAIARRASIDGYAADAKFSRKSRGVDELLANLERAAAAPRDVALPALLPSAAHVLAIAPDAGTSCATALTAASGDAVEKTLAPGSSIWIRVAPAKTRFVRVDTAPSSVDTEITLFGQSCPAGEDDAVAHNDDAYGLAAAVAIDSEDSSHSSGAHYARVRNIGHSAGDVVARVNATAAIVGRITDARNAQPIFAQAVAVTPDGYFLAQTQNDDSTGLYLLPVDPGTYYILAQGYYSPDFAYLSELYPDAACSTSYVYALAQCDTGSATPLTIADGQELDGINVALGIGARVAGIVRDALTGAPLSGASIAAYETNGEFGAVSTVTDLTGRYEVAGLVSGTYVLEATRDGYGSQLWNHVTCTGPIETDCEISGGTPLTLVRDTLTSSIDFDLPVEAHLHATILPRNGAPIPLGWELSIYDQSNAYVGASFVYGASSIDSVALAPGSYYAFVTADGYFGQLWNAIDCVADCGPPFDQAIPIKIARGQTIAVSFAPLVVPSVSGTVTDAATHEPLANASITLVPAKLEGSLVQAFTDPSGRYSLAPPTAGSYYVWANSSAYRGTLYPDVRCTDSVFQHCDLAAATPVTIAFAGSDVTGIDIAMPPDGSVSGRVVLRTPDGMVLPPMVPGYASVGLFTALDEYVASSGILTDGSYRVTNVPDGTYYATVQGPMFTEIYPRIDCEGACSPSQGSPIAVASGADTTGIDFDPIPYEYIFGRVTDVDGAPIPGAAIDLWQENDRHCGVSVTNADGYYAATDNLMPCQTPLLSTDADSSMYENQVYDGIPCPHGSVFLDLCSLDGATPVPFPTTPAFAIANFMLGPRPETIFASGFDP